jgi:Spy/CpxP family protein refolding chaperone
MRNTRTVLAAIALAAATAGLSPATQSQVYLGLGPGMPSYGTYGVPYGYYGGWDYRGHTGSNLHRYDYSITR